MTPLLLSIACIVAYAAACAVYAAELLDDEAPASDRGRPWLLAAAMVNASVVALAPLGAVEGGHMVLVPANALLLLALVISGGFLLLRTRFPVRVAGVLVAPVSALLVGLYAAGFASTRPSPTPMEPLLVTHITLALLGLGAFALAAVLSALYIAQERQLRTRQFGRFFQRLPSLGALDDANFRLILVGFVIFTVAVVLGVIQAFTLQNWVVDVRFVLSVAAWVVFASVIFTRIRTGWRGRQAAWLTILGCASTFVVLALYLG